MMTHQLLPRNRRHGRFTVPGLLALAGAAIFPAAHGQAETREDSRPWVLRYDKPAGQWVEALPLGNGRFGAMVFGGTEHERIKFNDDTLWAGQPRDYSHPGAADHLAAIRQLLWEGKHREAEALASEHFMSVPLRQLPYQPFGDLQVEFPGHAAAMDYARSLDLDQAVTGVEYRVDGVTYRRELFCSQPDQVLVVTLSADRPGALTFTAVLDSPHPATTRAAAGDVLCMAGQVAPYEEPRTRFRSESSIRFEAQLRARARGGTVVATDRAIEVRQADAATLLLVGATNYRDCEDLSADPRQRCCDLLAAAGKKSDEALRTAHVADHQRLFRRVDLDLGTSMAAGQTTDRRIQAFGPHDPQLAALYFQFGRYLTIAGSRPGTQPLNLQGIWNDSLRPPWDSKYTTNINCEMNYWPTEVCNLAECAEPLFDALEDADDPQNRHRHVSHLWGLYPGSEISEQTPDLRAAARKSLELRGDGGTGWSKAWKVNLWARLGDGDRAFRLLQGLIANSTLPNMFDQCPPFQIDGNFGGTAGIAQMLLQDPAGQIHLLPALPGASPTGRVRGLRARGGFEIDLQWADGQLQTASVRSRLGGPVTIRYRETCVTLPTQAGQAYRLATPALVEEKAQDP